MIVRARARAEFRCEGVAVWCSQAAPDMPQQSSNYSSRNGSVHGRRRGARGVGGSGSQLNAYIRPPTMPDRLSLPPDPICLRSLSLPFLQTVLVIGRELLDEAVHKLPTSPPPTTTQSNFPGGGCRNDPRQAAVYQTQPGLRSGEGGRRRLGQPVSAVG